MWAQKSAGWGCGGSLVAMNGEESRQGILSANFGAGENLGAGVYLVIRTESPPTES